MNISFLIGAGFSVPDGYPTREEINSRLRKISSDEIMIHTDGTALFLGKIPDPNTAWTNVAQKKFVERFLNYYTATIIDKPETFDYESFFDYYQGLLHGRLKCSKFNKFADGFRKANNYSMDNQNLLRNFHNTFNQLLSSLLRNKRPQKCHLASPYIKYGPFLSFIEEVKNNYDKIFFHTLNHDLLLEELSDSDAILSMSDGFEELGSPFYSKNNDDLTVRLRRFTNDFSKKFCLYKLHGSIDHYVYFQKQEKIVVKVPYGVSSNGLMKEVYDVKGELKYDKCFSNYYPDFLSGTTEKIHSYEEAYFYKPIFTHFRKNLHTSECLISIGYGLGDSKINELIKNNFLNNKSKTMVVIAPDKPKSDLFDLENVKYYGLTKGVESIDKAAIDELLLSVELS